MSMRFFSEWKEQLDNDDFVVAFLSKSKDSMDELEKGSLSEIMIAYDVLQGIPLEHFIDILARFDFSRDAKPAEIPQFSNFEDGAIRLPEILEFEEDGLTFLEAGYKLVKAKTEGACVKYGENHSKLAMMMSLIYKNLSKVYNTALGTYMVTLHSEEKMDILKKLLLREYFIQKIICAAIVDIVNYRKIAVSLSDSTALRRRSNVKFLVEFILNGSEYENAKNNIQW